MFQTKVMPCDEKGVAFAAELLKKGEVVGIPTETVYGLAASAYDPAAVSKIFAAKGRPQDNPLIVHISDLSMLNDLVSDFPPIAQKLASAFWPGPLTMILPKSERVPFEVTAGLDTVGIRMSSHPGAAAVIKACGLPLAAPSANTSGRPSPTKAKHVLYDMNGKIPLILDGGSCSVGVESTVILVKKDSVHLLRPGGVTEKDIESLGIIVTVDPAVETKLKQNAKVLSPGLKYKHYSPKAEVVIVKGSFDQFKEYVSHKTEDGVFVLVFEGEDKLVNWPAVVYGKKSDPKAQAAGLFDALREVDERGARLVYARCPDQDGVGYAVYNRLLRAAAFKVVEV